MCDLLGVEERQVRALAERAQIIRLARGVYDRVSVERHRAIRGTGRTRTWDEVTAWGVISMLAGVTAPRDLGDTQIYRLRAAVHAITDPADLAIRLRERAVVMPCSGHRSVLDRLRKDPDLVRPGRKRIGLVEDSSIVDGYVHEDRFRDLVDRHHLDEDRPGAITLRVTTMDFKHVSTVNEMRRTLAAVDAATSLDPRERGAGEAILERALELFRVNVPR